jgi:hypothetical protein
MTPLIWLALGAAALFLYSGGATAATKTYPAMGTKFFPAKAGDRVLLTAEMSSPNWAALTSGVANMTEYLTNQFTRSMPPGAAIEGFASSPIANGVKLSVVIKYGVDTNVPLGQLAIPIEIPRAGEAPTMEPGTFTIISAKNLDTGHELSI